MDESDLSQSSNANISTIAADPCDVPAKIRQKFLPCRMEDLFCSDSCTCGTRSRPFANMEPPKFEEDFAVKLQFFSLYFGEGEEFLSPLRKFVTPGVGGYKADFGLTLVIFSRRSSTCASLDCGWKSVFYLEHRRKEGDCCFWDRENTSSRTSEFRGTTDRESSSSRSCR
ncbi:hypothetical protein BSL78_29016 [Apostichopus japonicus]|uniref:Uncharacterized protein n=1 Tax=Stichopus japonicus TaxID=307972 RepID=A0A2G8JEH4_STIJA|nr:hypothetical protein BSL78_29016 [Apostichopus japonicus]